MTKDLSENLAAELPKTLYLFIDESGNFDFSPKGTKYFTLTGLITFDPVLRREELLRLRYELLASGHNLEHFHATEDTQATRDRMFTFLASLGDSFEVRSIIAQKNKTHPSLYKESYMKGDRLIERVTGLGLYKQLCETLLKYIFRGKDGEVGKIVVVLGSLFNGDKKKVLLQTLKHHLKEHFPHIPFEIYSHATTADLNCQLADYCCWAVSVKYERGEERPYEAIKSQIKSVFDIFAVGKHEYYPYEN